MWWWVAVGCSGSVPPEEDRLSWEGDFLIDEIVIDCDAAGWTYSVRAQGWGDEITVDVVQRAYGALLWHENHGLIEVEYGEDWSRFEISLDRVYDGSEYTSSESTAFPCDAKTFVTYGFAAWRYDGERQECVAWGIDPEGEFPDCANWGDNGHDDL